MMTPGIIISTFLASRLDSFYLSIIFAVFMFYSSIQMFIGEKTKPENKIFSNYGKRSDKLGTLVFKDIIQREVLIWKHIDSETIFDYKQLLQTLLDLDYTIQAIIIDGKRGLYKAFPCRCVTFINERLLTVI